MTIFYIPKVLCAKCGTECAVERIHQHKPERRYLRVKCHGAETETAFVREAGQTVTVFEAEAA